MLTMAYTKFISAENIKCSWWIADYYYNSYSFSACFFARNLLKQLNFGLLLVKWSAHVTCFVNHSFNHLIFFRFCINYTKWNIRSSSLRCLFTFSRTYKHTRRTFHKIAMQYVLFSLSTIVTPMVIICTVLEPFWTGVLEKNNQESLLHYEQTHSHYLPDIFLC